MTDRLSERLHDGIERVPASPRHAPDVRQGAEHGRRIRRAFGGVLAAGLVVAVAVGWGLRGDLLSAPGPATTPSPGATAGGLAADPYLTDADWALFTGSLDVVRAGSPPLRPMECVADAGALGSTELRSARYVDRGRPGAAINEFLLRFDDEAGASRAFADLRARFAGCGWQTVDLSGADPRDPLDDIYVAEGARAGSQVVPNLYQVGVARDGAVVVIVESTGWADRTSRTLAYALVRAIPAERERCGLDTGGIPVCAPPSASGQGS